MATAIQATQAPPRIRSRYDHIFFPCVAGMILISVFVGFAQSYYLQGVLTLPPWKAFAAPPHPLLVHIHAVVFSSWILLLVVQTSLVAVDRVDVHRRLGLAGFGLACLLVLVGLAVTCEFLSRHHVHEDPNLRFPFLQAVELLTFSTLIFFGYRQRFDPVAHNEKIREKGDDLSFDFDRDPAYLDRARRIYDATSFDLRAFKARVGKMLLWHGWADGAIMATSSIGYYEGVVKFTGGRKQAEDFFHLFLVPGVHHGGGGPGLTDFDALTELENWVEKGQPPERLIACRSVNGLAERRRPVFPYPVLAHYSGKGDPKQAENFVPLDPSGH